MVKCGLILAAGNGTRARPLTYDIAKPMFPFGEGRSIDIPLSYVINAGLRPVIVAGYKNKNLVNYLQSKYSHIDLCLIEKPNTNLLDSIVAAKNYVKGEDFLWMGASQFFQSNNAIKRLINCFEKSGSFITLYKQKEFCYKPKLVINSSNELSSFIVGESSTIYSSPTAFVCKNKFIEQFLVNYGERIAFQQAIDKGLKFECVDLDSSSIEIHTLPEYFHAQSMIYGPVFIDSNSRIRGETSYSNTYIYGSSVENSRLMNCVIIDSHLTNSYISDAIVFKNKIIQSNAMKEAG